MRLKTKIRQAGRAAVGVLFALGWCFSAGAALFEVAEGDGDSNTLATGIPGASLKTDSETDDLLSRANQFAEQGRYDLASTLWQTVIDSSNDLVFSRDEWIEKTLEHSYQRYRSVTGDIEGTLAKLPDAGLEGYRIKADGEAKRVLARPGDDGREAALAEVVRRYFLSSLGDDAAFELACRKLDRYEFLPAIRLLAKVADEYPSPSVEKDEVLLRMAALNGRVGDPQRAMEILEDLRSRVTPSVPDDVLVLVEADIKKASRGDISDKLDGDVLWPMAMGGPNRMGTMLAPKLAPKKDAVAAEGWAQPWSLDVPEGWPALPKAKDKLVIDIDLENPFAVAGRTSSRNKPKKPSTPESRLKDWPRHGWYPSARALFAGGRMYFKNADRLVCADAATGELRWLGFRNEYPFPPVLGNTRTYNRSGDDNDKVGRAPKDQGEVQEFGDSVHQSMCVVRDKVLTLQGKPIDFTEENMPLAAAAPPGRVIARGAGSAQASRYRENRLVAYHARNGKLQWMRTAEEPGERAVGKRTCFAGPPVPYAGLVLIPVIEERGMFLSAIDSEGGATLWRTFLGDEPTLTVPGSAIMISVDGGEAYVATGAGLVFSVDAISGSMNWAVRYERTPQDAAAVQRNMQMRGFRSSSQLARFDGWNEEMIIPSGNTLIVTPSDFNHVIAFDRRTGSLLWESARQPGEDSDAADYALGVQDGKFYAAGNEVLRCYRVSGGRMLWETQFDSGHGRGALTSDGIYMPSGDDKIVKIDPEGGKVLYAFSVAVEAPAEKKEDEDEAPAEEARMQPAGNLYSDGERLFGLGAQRIYTIKALSEDEVSARAAEKERMAAERKLAAERKAAEPKAKPGGLASVADELEATMESFPDALKKAVDGDKTALDAAIKRIEEAVATLADMPEPSAEVLAENRKRFKARAAEVGEKMRGITRDSGVEIEELMDEFSDRMETADAVLSRFGFSESHEEE